MKILHLNLKKEYFIEILTGEKVQEFRLYNEYWRRRLEGREYDVIHINCGYPKKDDWSRKTARVYRGYQIKTITHPHFGPDPVEVFAIWVN